MTEALKAYPSLQLFCGDDGYRETSVLHAFKVLKKEFMLSPKIKGLIVFPKRWVVEQTFAWLGNCRRLAKDFEKRVKYAESWIRIAMLSIMFNKVEAPEIL